jgi:hypothetical protein
MSAIPPEAWRPSRYWRNREYWSDVGALGFISPIRSALASITLRMLRDTRNSSASTRTDTQARQPSQAGR